MSIRIRHQDFAPKAKRASVEIISVDQFTRRARLIEKSKSERQHLFRVLLALTPKHYSLFDLKTQHSHSFWIEKP